VSVARFIAAQRTEHRVPHAVACRALGVSQSWFYKWHGRGLSPRAARRVELDQAVAGVFWARQGTYGSPRITAELREQGRRVSLNTVAVSMARQQLVARGKRRRRGTTRAGRGRWRAGDLLGREFTATGINQRWCGDGTEIPTGQGKLYLYVVLDLFSRRVPGFAMDVHHNEPLARAALQTAAAVRGGDVVGVVFHSDQGSEGGFNRSSQRLDHGGLRWVGARRHRWRRPRACGGSGRRIGRCVRRCGHRDGRSRLVRCSGASGGGSLRG
jgi:transposase InsO family protein